MTKTRDKDFVTTRAKQFCTPRSLDISFSVTLKRTELQESSLLPIKEVAIVLATDGVKKRLILRMSYIPDI